MKKKINNSVYLFFLSFFVVILLGGVGGWFWGGLDNPSSQEEKKLITPVSTIDIPKFRREYLEEEDVVMGKESDLFFSVTFTITVTSTSTSTPTVFSSSTATPTSTSVDNLAQENEVGKVVRVISGDEFIIDNGKYIRMLAIDAPNMSEEDYECLANEARDFLEELILNKVVVLAKDVSNYDPSGEKLLRYVYTGDGFINELMVQNGYAEVAIYPPDVQFWKELRTAEEKAKTEDKGIWSSCRN